MITCILINRSGKEMSIVFVFSIRIRYGKCREEREGL